jgi:hypothetical protein
MLKLSHEIAEYKDRVPYDASDRQIVNSFISRFATRVIWLYEEASKRGVHNDYLKNVCQFPGKLQTKDHVYRIAEELEKFGVIVRLYV